MVTKNAVFMRSVAFRKRLYSIHKRGEIAMKNIFHTEPRAADALDQIRCVLSSFSFIFSFSLMIGFLKTSPRNRDAIRKMHR